MTDSEKEQAQALINAVALQRNQAMDAAVALMAENTRLQKQLSAATAQIQEMLTAKEKNHE